MFKSIMEVLKLSICDVIMVKKKVMVGIFIKNFFIWFGLVMVYFLLVRMVIGFFEVFVVIVFKLMVICM